ncbi:MAG: FHA domain-containing protein [Victivallales bacterium]|nr:FHA domain-containing protein [Victivallales bacterium]
MRGEELRKFDTEEFGNSISIGRSSSCEVCLKGSAENNVSREHIVLKKTMGNWTLVSKGHSGVYKNAEKVSSVPIEDGDVFRFSQLFLCIGSKCGPSPYDVTWDADTEDGNRRAVLWPGTNTIGASHDNYVMVRTQDVSRFHGRIILEPNGIIYFENIYHSVFSAVNGNQVGKERVEVQPGDSILLGETEVFITKGIRVSQDAAVRSIVKKPPSRAELMAKSPLAKLVIAVFIILVLTLLFNFFATIYQILLG